MRRLTNEREENVHSKKIKSLPLFNPERLKRKAIESKSFSLKNDSKQKDSLFCVSIVDESDTSLDKGENTQRGDLKTSFTYGGNIFRLKSLFLIEF